ncbi:MAG: hypothetical protein ACXVRZ_14160 [Gaiellaceae bacterium]
MARDEVEIVAQQVSTLSAKIEALERRLAELDMVIARMEVAALTTARSLQEISKHWDAVYEAMRRPEVPEDPDVGQLSSE